MIFRNYNDFEIINLIKQGDDEAFQLMVNKYKYFIAKKIKQFNLVYDYEDCFQESLILLHKSVIKYDETYGKTFTKFFELNLIHYLISYKKKKNNYFTFIYEKLPIYQHNTVEEPIKNEYLDHEVIEALENLSKFEKKVFQVKIIEKRTVRETAKIISTDEKKIYNALDRIRNKVKIHLIQ
ncbi:sigma-70 family RNA polymerase sigma factor [Mycoplasmatota bacterium]|nr:sigma-70 family RNA polymerase sigma factor [Mycoplasmatota bacterium]